MPTADPSIADETERVEIVVEKDHNGSAFGSRSVDPVSGFGHLRRELTLAAPAVVFGSTGGGEAFAFDVTGQVVLVPWIGDVTDAIPQGPFHEFLSRLLDDGLFDPVE